MHNLEKILLTAAGIACFFAMWVILRKTGKAKASFIFLLTAVLFVDTGIGRGAMRLS